MDGREIWVQPLILQGAALERYIGAGFDFLFHSNAGARPMLRFDRDIATQGPRREAVPRRDADGASAAAARLDGRGRVERRGAQRCERALASSKRSTPETTIIERTIPLMNPHAQWGGSDGQMNIERSETRRGGQAGCEISERREALYRTIPNWRELLAAVRAGRSGIR